MKPKFTDAARYPNGYTPASKTDIKKTFARIREQHKRNQEEAALKVAPLKRAAK
jgi:hypothetical protein